MRYEYKYNITPFSHNFKLYLIIFIITFDYVSVNSKRTKKQIYRQLEAYLFFLYIDIIHDIQRLCCHCYVCYIKSVILTLNLICNNNRFKKIQYRSKLFSAAIVNHNVYCSLLHSANLSIFNQFNLPLSCHSRQFDGYEHKNLFT